MFGKKKSTGTPRRRKSFVRNGPGRREMTKHLGGGRQFKKWNKGRRRARKAAGLNW